MKTALNEAGLNENGLGWERLAALAARHGFDGIDFGVRALKKAAGERSGGAPAVRDHLAALGVAPAAFDLPVEWRRDEETFSAGMAAFPEEAALAAAIGATRCCTWMPPSVDGELADWEAQTVRRFRAVARVLADHGIRLGLEWVGPHHLRAGPEAMGANPWLYTLDGTRALIAEIAEPNVGLLVDSYHCFTTGVGRDEIAAYQRSRFGVGGRSGTICM